MNQTTQRKIETATEVAIYKQTEEEAQVTTELENRAPTLIIP